MAGKLKKILKEAADRHGVTQARRIERAAEEANLERFPEATLRNTFLQDDFGVSPGGLYTTMKPESFETFGVPISSDMKDMVPYPRWKNLLKTEQAKWKRRPGGLDFENYIDNLAQHIDDKGMPPGIPPTLWLGRQDGTNVVAHEGRHRMRGLGELGDDRGFVQLRPANYGELTGAPDEVAQRMLEKYFNNKPWLTDIEPESQSILNRPTVKFDDVWAKGGQVPEFGGPTGFVKKGLGALSNKIRTYTGSPYKFDKFDPAFIGKGEGTAAYGHGFYSAEEPNVAEEYRRMTGSKSDSPGGWTNYGTPVDDLRANSILESILQQRLGHRPDDLPALTKDISGLLNIGMSPERMDSVLRIAPGTSKLLIDSMPGGFARQKPGWLYSLDLNAKPSDFFDWDAPVDAKTWNRIHPNVQDALNSAVEDRGWNPFDAGEYKGHELFSGLMHHDVHDTLPPDLASSSWTTGNTDPKKHTSAYLSEIGFPGLRFFDKYSRNKVEGTRNYVVFPESSDIIDIVNRSKAEGGRIERERGTPTPKIRDNLPPPMYPHYPEDSGREVEPELYLTQPWGPYKHSLPGARGWENDDRQVAGFDDGGQVEGGGALSQLAAINPLKWIKFFEGRGLNESLDPSVARAVDRVVDHVNTTGNEGIISGRYGDNLVKPYTSKLVPGKKGSAPITPVIRKNLWSAGPGQMYTVHPHPDMDVPLGGSVPWSNMPSTGDIESVYLPRDMWAQRNRHLPEMMIANQHGNLVRFGGLHTALDGGYSQSGDIVKHLRNILSESSRFGATKEERLAQHAALADWARAHGITDFDPTMSIIHPTTKTPFRTSSAAALDLGTVPALNRLTQMGVPVDVQGTLPGHPNVSLGDAMRSWGNYLEGKTGESLDPQMNFDFSKAEGGMIDKPRGALRKYRIGGFGEIGLEDDDSEGALTQVGWKEKAAEAMRRRTARAVEQESLINKTMRAPKEDPIYLAPDPKMQTVKDPERLAFPGIYKSPQQIIEEAKARYDAGDEDAMRRLFGMGRNELDEMSQARDYSNLLLVPHAYYPPPGATGSKISDKVLTNKNMNRIVDIAGEALDDPQLRLTRSWYEMQPLWNRMTQLGTDPAYQRMFNTRVGLHSAGASPVSEINRGTGANWLIEQGRLQDYMDYAGIPESQRGRLHNSFPPDMLDIPGHAYHKTAHSKPLINLEASGQLWTDRHKVPTYVQATDPILADPRRPIADAHLARGVGYSDVRTGGIDNLFKELTTSEYGDFVPWWEQASGKVDMWPRDMQAMIWNALGPQTGVRIIGPGKLEMLSGQIMKAAQRLGVSPETARDLILTGKAGAYQEGGQVQNFDEGGKPDPRGVLSRINDNSEAWRTRPFDEYAELAKALIPLALQHEGSRFADNAGYNPAKYGVDVVNRIGRGVDKGVSNLWDLIKQRYSEAGDPRIFAANTALRGAKVIGEGMIPSFDFSRQYGPAGAPIDAMNIGLSTGKNVAGNIGRSLFARGGYLQGGDVAEGGMSLPDLPNLGAGIFDGGGMGAKSLIPGATDEFGNLPDMARKTPEPLKFAMPQAQQQGGGGKGGSGIGSLLGPIGAIAGSFIPGVGTAIGGAAGSMLGQMMGSHGGYVSDLTPHYATGGYVEPEDRRGRLPSPTMDDEFAAYHVMNYANGGQVFDLGGQVQSRPNSEMWPGAYDPSETKPLDFGGGDSSLQQGSTGLGGLMQGLLPMLLGGIGGGKGGGGFGDIASILSPGMAIGKSIGLFDEGGQVPHGALRYCSGGRY